MTALQKHLKEIEACGVAKKWAGDRTPQEAWNQSPRADWLLWWAVRTQVNGRQDIVGAAFSCLERVRALGGGKWARWATRWVVEEPTLPWEARSREVAGWAAEAAEVVGWVAWEVAADRILVQLTNAPNFSKSARDQYLVDRQIERDTERAAELAEAAEHIKMCGEIREHLACPYAGDLSPA